MTTYQTSPDEAAFEAQAARIRELEDRLARQDRWIRAASEVCQCAARGDLEHRVLSIDGDDDLSELLHALKDPDWSRFKEHPRFGPMIAGDLLAAWCAHDALHLRQLARRLHQLAQRDAAGGTIRYAGDW